MTITLTIDLEDNQSTNMVRTVLMDALYEFVAHRGPTAEMYVGARYPKTPGYAWLDREQKIREVNRRIMLANTLHKAVGMQVTA